MATFRDTSSDDTTEAPRVRGSGAQKVYETLRKAILELELDPGSPLDEVSLSAQFDMSRTPIREALVRLAAEGLVTTLPNRNTIVATIDFVRLPVYFEALSLMYRVTTRLAAINRRPEQLISIRAWQAAFAEAVERQDALAMIASNRDFHVAIAEAGGNRISPSCSPGCSTRAGASCGSTIPASTTGCPGSMSKSTNCW
jgi:DNA-binding GntR family transcriptional regulator